MFKYQFPNKTDTISINILLNIYPKLMKLYYQLIDYNLVKEWTKIQRKKTIFRSKSFPFSSACFTEIYDFLKKYFDLSFFLCLYELKF